MGPDGVDRHRQVGRVGRSGSRGVSFTPSRDVAVTSYTPRRTLCETSVQDVLRRPLQTGVARTHSPGLISYNGDRLSGSHDEVPLLRSRYLLVLGVRIVDQGIPGTSTPSETQSSIRHFLPVPHPNVLMNGRRGTWGRRSLVQCGGVVGVGLWTLSGVRRGALSTTHTRIDPGPR